MNSAPETFPLGLPTGDHAAGPTLFDDHAGRCLAALAARVCDAPWALFAGGGAEGLQPESVHGPVPPAALAALELLGRVGRCGLHVIEDLATRGDWKPAAHHPEGDPAPDLAPVRFLAGRVFPAAGGGQNAPAGALCVMAPGPRRLTDAQAAALAEVADLAAALLAARAAQRQELERLQHHDALTGLPNRERAVEQLGRLMAQAGAVAWLTVGLDRFKGVNETLGRGASDQILREAAERLRECVPLTAVVARQFGAVFSVALPGVGGPQDLEPTGRAVLNTLARPFRVGGRDVTLSASIGAALAPRDAQDAEALERCAEIAFNRAAGAGGHRVNYYDPHLGQEARERFSLERELKLALDRGQFRLLYQPQTVTRTGQVRGVEILLRWEHPKRGLLPPADFLAVAEETGLMVPIGEWAARTACLQFKRWLDAGLPLARLALNVSPRELAQADLDRRLGRLLADVGLDPKQVELELSESLLAAEDFQGDAVLAGLNALGVSLALDDFGTSRLSFARLKRLPLGVVKIDGALVRAAAGNPSQAAIVKAMIDAGHSLRLEVIAEGVETMVQFDWLRANGCDAVQGYQFGRPQAPEDLFPWLRTHESGPAGMPANATASAHAEPWPEPATTRSGAGASGKSF